MQQRLQQLELETSVKRDGETRTFDLLIGDQAGIEFRAALAENRQL